MKVNKQEDKTKLWNNFVKIKKLQKQGPKAKCVTLPKSWLEALDWNLNTHIVLTCDFFTKEIKIREMTDDLKLDEKPLIGYELKTDAQVQNVPEGEELKPQEDIVKKIGEEVSNIESKSD